MRPKEHPRTFSPLSTAQAAHVTQTQTATRPGDSAQCCKIQPKTGPGPLSRVPTVPIMYPCVPSHVPPAKSKRPCIYWLKCFSTLEGVSRYTRVHVFSRVATVVHFKGVSRSFFWLHGCSMPHNTQKSCNHVYLMYSCTGRAQRSKRANVYKGILLQGRVHKGYTTVHQVHERGPGMPAGPDQAGTVTT